MTKADILLVFDLIDTNGNGKVEYREFTQAVKIYTKELQAARIRAR